LGYVVVYRTQRINMGMNDGADETKAEIYETIAAINRAFAEITTSLYKLESKGVLAEDYAYNQEVPLRELAARINCYIISKVNERELDDRNHYGRMWASLAKRNNAHRSS
jgi:hypothetical protein